MVIKRSIRVFCPCQFPVGQFPPLFKNYKRILFVILTMTQVAEEKDCGGGHDVRFENPSSFLFAGVSQAGKTILAMNFLRNIDLLFKTPACKQNVIWYYHQWQPAYESFSKENIVKEWIPKLPTEDDVLEKTLLYKGKGGSLIVIDDFAQEVNKDTVNLFSILVHHTDTTAFLLTQNIFCKNPAFRDISLNATYVILFKNPRDGSQIVNLAKQFSPGNNQFVVATYKEATQKAHSYLLFDSHQKTCEHLRLRSNIFGVDEPPKSYFLPRES
jgi:hypothetical protein